MCVIARKRRMIPSDLVVSEQAFSIIRADAGGITLASTMVKCLIAVRRPRPVFASRQRRDAIKSRMWLGVTSPGRVLANPPRLEAFSVSAPQCLPRNTLQHSLEDHFRLGATPSKQQWRRGGPDLGGWVKRSGPLLWAEGADLKPRWCPS